MAIASFIDDFQAPLHQNRNISEKIGHFSKTGLNINREQKSFALTKDGFLMKKLLGIASVVLLAAPTVQASVTPIRAEQAPLTTTEQKPKAEAVTVANFNVNCSDGMVRFTYWELCYN
ncbi:MAG: hypothetical protein LBJ33_14950 [Pseudomonas putida]|nr:hypothetical protein [Pseudomonas putida]